MTRAHLQQELHRIWQAEGITMILVTHDVEEAVYLGDRVVVMEPRAGRVRRIVPVDLPHPRNRAAAGFVEVKDSVLREFAGHTDVTDVLAVPEHGPHEPPTRSGGSGGLPAGIRFAF